VLWNLDEMNTPDCMGRLVARSLARRSEAAGSETLLLHDLQRDLIHKRREMELPGLHFRLVESWNALPKIPDVYAWRWIAYHLIQAGCFPNICFSANHEHVLCIDHRPLHVFHYVIARPHVEAVEHYINPILDESNGKRSNPSLMFFRVVRIGDEGYRIRGGSRTRTRWVNIIF
jgi:hypothetical protein